MKSLSSLEPLEPRIAPASVTVNAAAKTATWTDYDGDLVKLKWTTNAPTFTTTDVGLGLRVDLIGLTIANNSNEAFTLTVKAVPGSDGHIDLGRIGAVGVPLKSWSSPAASVLEIDCGNGTTGIGSLKIGTLTVKPLSSFSPVGGDGASAITGAISTIVVLGDIGAGGLLINQAGQVKTIRITGSLRGTDEAGMSITSGLISFFGTSIDSFTLGGSVLGSDAPGSGQLRLQASVGRLVIKGSIVGGSSDSTGVVVADAKTVVIGGNVQGGSAPISGFLSLADVKNVTIGGSILGGSDEGTGRLGLNSAVAIAIKGSIVGGLNTAATGTGDAGLLSAVKNVGSIKIGGDLVAGSYGSGTRLEYNGAITVDGNLGSIVIAGGIHGNTDTDALILAKGTTPTQPGNFNAIGKVKIAGTVSYGYIASGHSRNGSGVAGDRVDDAENPDAGIGSVIVGGDWFHSSLTAGVTDSNTTGFTSSDTHPTGNVARLAKIGAVSVKGYILDSPNAPGFSGFGADKIGRIVAHGLTLFTTGDPARSLDAGALVDVKEFA